MKYRKINSAWIIRTLLLGTMSVMVAILLFIMGYALIVNQSRKQLAIAKVEEHSRIKETYGSELVDPEKTNILSETEYFSGREK